MKKKYLLNVTFHAGSDSPGDTEKGLYLLIMDKEITSKRQMENIFSETNKLLNCFDGEERDFPISYKYGININTLMGGIKYYTKGEVIQYYDCYECGDLGHVDCYYVIKQWQ